MDPIVWSDSYYSKQFEFFPNLSFLSINYSKIQEFLSLFNCVYNRIVWTKNQYPYLDGKIQISAAQNKNCQINLYCRNHVNASTNFLRNVSRWKFKWYFLITFVPLCIPNLYLWSEMNAAKKPKERKTNMHLIL